MKSKNKIKQHTILSGVLLNLVMVIIFIFFIILGNENVTHNADIQNNTYRTNFHSRLTLKSINGLNHTRYYLLRALKENNVDLIWEAEDQLLAAHSNFKILMSEQFQNKSKPSNRFDPYFTEINPLFVKLSESANPLAEKALINSITEKIDNLVDLLFQEESGLWIEESFKFARFSELKEKNSNIFYGLIALFFIIQLGLIYFTILRYRLNKKINQQHEQLVLQTRLSTLGMMSAELAHEINSPLMVIDGRLRIVTNDLNAQELDKEKLFKNLEVIKRNSKRIQSIIKSFKTLSKSGDNDPFEHHELKSILEEVNELVAQKLSDEKIRLVIEDHTHNAIIEVRKIQIIQVLTNLVNNSLDAIKQTTEPWIKIESFKTNDHIVITVTDSGTGIPTEARNHIFEPFYSTKNSAQGTGLGLSISKKIMKEHDGDLIYQSDSANTQFKLLFKKK